MSTLTIALEAVIAIARADVAEHGYAAPRARFVFAGALAPIEVHPIAARDAALDGVPREQIAEVIGDHYCAQLMRGHDAIGTEIGKLGELQLRAGARMIVSYMAPLPEQIDDAMFGCYIEIWDPHEQRCLMRGVLPMHVTDGTPSLGSFQLLSVDHTAPLTELN